MEVIADVTKDSMETDNHPTSLIDIVFSPELKNDWKMYYLPFDKSGDTEDASTVDDRPVFFPLAVIRVESCSWEGSTVLQG